MVEKSNKYDEWNIKDAASTLRRAEEILDDPKMIKLVKKQLTKEIETTNEVAKRLDLETKVGKKLKKVF